MTKQPAIRLRKGFWGGYDVYTARGATIFGEYLGFNTRKEARIAAVEMSLKYGFPILDTTKEQS